MNQIIVLTRVNVVTPEQLCKLDKFLGLETPKGRRYVRNTWCSSQDNFKFWYPFVGGPESSVYTCIEGPGDIIRLVSDGCKFFEFETANEMYSWMAGGK